ncbi:MAG TPA: P-type conjugative transfer protein TrbL [Gemmatimonadaceae bacterium]|nr:P-type conjugative transfer protein TrbL [Gemmatimonadaceae bacterium]
MRVLAWATSRRTYARLKHWYVTYPMVRWSIAAGVIILLALGATLHAQGTPPNGNPQMLDGIAGAYRTASQVWVARLLPIAQRTFALLATLELIISGTLWTFRRDTIDDIAGRFLLKFILMSFMLTLITGFHTWVPPIIAGFVTAGESATGLSGLSPSAVLELGWQASAAILHSISVSNAVLDPITSLFVVLLAFVMWLAFVVIAAQLLRVLVESYLILSGGVLFLGMAGFRATAGYAENYLNYAVAVGIKIFVLYLIVGIGMSLATQWAAMLTTDNWDIGAGNPTLLPQIVGGTVILAILTVSLPGAFAARITGSHSLGVAHALRSL